MDLIPDALIEVMTNQELMVYQMKAKGMQAAAIAQELGMETDQVKATIRVYNQKAASVGFVPAIVLVPRP